MKASRHWIWPILLVPIAIGLSRLHFDVEVLDLLPEGSRVVQGLKLYQETFSDARELIVTVESPDADVTQEAARTISEALASRTGEIEDIVWQPPWIEHPDQAGELIAFLWLNQPPELFKQLARSLAATNRSAILTAARDQLSTSMSPAEIAQLSYDPYGLTRLPQSASTAAPDFARGQQFFSSADGTFRILFVRSRGDLSSYHDCARWLDSIVRAVDSAAPPGGWRGRGVQVGYTGRPAFVSEIAGGMERDTAISVGGTALIIAVLFWFAHRRWKPMLWLLTLLALVLLGTLGFGGLIFGTINVISVGFAAILLGLAVDYAVVHYQEALAHPDLSIPEVRRAIAPSIFWAAVTTISAFLVLNLGGLPGLAQLGTLVGVGVGLSALVMIFAFLPPLFPHRWTGGDPVAVGMRESSAKTIHGGNRRAVMTATALLVVLAVVTLSLGLPGVDSSANALRPRNSPAYAALEKIKARLNQNSDPLWLIVAGRDESEVARRLDEVKPLLTTAVSNREISGFTLADVLWPRPEFQSANRATAAALASMRDGLAGDAEASGFASNSMALTRGILDTWSQTAGVKGVFWPTNRTSQWIFQRLVGRKPGRLLSVGLIHPTPARSGAGRASMPTLVNGLPGENVWLSGWGLLGIAIFQDVTGNLWKLVVPMIALVLLSLALAFRRRTEVLLSLAVLALSGLCLLTSMRLAGWSWNLLNLMALPLILGTGVDYTIFMQLALRRHRGDLALAHRSVGRALLLCGATAVAGFGSLAWSGNAGMASLGQVCAVGIGCNMLIAVFLLPTWWSVCTKG